MPDARRATGARGERHAAARLIDEGYRVVERNARTRHGEIDLIAVGRDCLVFCEVRARIAVGSAAPQAAGGPAGPLESIGPQKRRRLRRLASEWIAARRAGDGAWPASVERLRFDAIGVLLAPDGTLLELEHVEDAF